MLRQMIKLFSSLICILVLSLFLSCDDDAILTPENESECTGSYCSLNLPGMLYKSKYVNPSTF